MASTATDLRSDDSDEEDNHEEEETKKPRSSKGHAVSSKKLTATETLLLLEETLQQYNERHTHPVATSNVYAAQKRVVALGDVHADKRFAIQALQLAKVVDHDGKWIGKDCFVIQTGDQVDGYRSEHVDEYDAKERAKTKNGMDDMEVLDFFDELDVQAREHGGRVISLLGNHEFNQFFHDFRYTNYDSTKRWNYDIEGRRKAFAHGGSEARRMAYTRPIYVIVGATMFCHAGF